MFKLHYLYLLEEHDLYMFKLHNLCLLNEYDPYMLKLHNLLYKQDFCFSFIYAMVSIKITWF